MPAKDYIVVVQCHIVKERCPGYNCERAFHAREGRFIEYPKEHPMRLLAITCGGCCGRAVHRKLAKLRKSIKKKEGIEQDRIRVHLASCITSDSSHGPPCPHKEYLTTLIRDKLGLDLVEGTVLSKEAVERLKEELSRNP
ncbi:MAG: CGGC domain-containing protein [Planctomycetota bacterium]